MRPENTLPAFEYAISVGADVLELDVAVTRDDVVVVSHDAKFNPAICTSPTRLRAIRELTFSELAQWDCGTLGNRRFPKQTPVQGARIPALDQVLALADRGSFQFNIEIKSFPDRPRLTPPPERLAELVWQVIRQRRLERRVIVQSFDFRTLHAMRSLAPEIRIAALYVGAPRSFVSIARRAGAQIVAPYHALVTPRKVRAAHASGLEVIPWTPNRPRDWKRLIAAGVDAMITDDPGALLAYLRGLGLH